MTDRKEEIEKMPVKVRSKNIAERLAYDIISVQPIDGDAISKMLEISKSDNELREEGYSPVSSMGLLWKKDP